MFRILYPLKDATIYDRYPELNSGIDQILELTKNTEGNVYQYVDDPEATYAQTFNSRILIKFDITPIQTIIQENPNCRFNCKLNLYNTEANSNPIDYTIAVYPLAEDWRNGTGNYNDDPIVKNGVCWYYKSSAVTADTWSRAYSYLDTIEVGGGSWLTSSYATQSFSYESPDLNIDITNVLLGWLSSSYANNGVIIKFLNSNETDTSIMGSLKFFSKDTHTIYSPKLVFNYYTSASYTGSFNTASSADIMDSVIHIKNLKASYNVHDSARLRLKTRETIPTPTFQSSSVDYAGLKLPTNTYFSIIDAVTKIKIIDFDASGSRIGIDDYGHYIDVNFNGFMPDRFYKIIFRTSDGGFTRDLDFEHTFKIAK